MCHHLSGEAVQFPILSNHLHLLLETHIKRLHPVCLLCIAYLSRAGKVVGYLFPYYGTPKHIGRKWLASRVLEICENLVNL